MINRKIEIVEPSGYCAGVKNAIRIAIQAKKDNPEKNIYILGMLVHNQKVIDYLLKKGITTIDNIKNGKEEAIKNIKKGSVIIFSAHGHNPNLDEIVKERGLIIYDATCPKVKNNLQLIKSAILNKQTVIYIGQNGHPECDASISLSNKVSLYDTNIPFNYHLITNDSPLVINQTTLNYFTLSSIHEDIKKHFPNATIMNEICASTRLRQEAVLSIPQECDLIIIVGDKKSSNSNKLLDIAIKTHPHSLCVMVNSTKDLSDEILFNKKYISIASGASTMPETIKQIYDYLNKNN